MQGKMNVGVKGVRSSRTTLLLVFLADLRDRWAIRDSMMDILSLSKTANPWRSHVLHSIIA